MADHELCLQGLHIISHDAIKVARAGSRGCLSTKVYKASSREQMALNRFIRRSLHPRKKWQGQRASCSTMGESHQLQGPNKFLLPAEVASRIAKLSILPWAPVCRLLCSHWYVSSGFRTTCLADRTFTGHVLKAAGSWPGAVQLLSTSQFSFTSFAVPRNEGAFRVEGIQGRMAGEQVELASVQQEK